MSSSVEFVESKRGRPILVYSGNRSCSGSVTTNSEKVVIYESNHSCVPNLAKVEVEKCLNKCRKWAREELTPLSKIFSEEISKVKDAGLDFVTEVPNLGSIKSGLYQQRRKALGVSSFTHKEHIVIPEIYSNNFLLIDDGKADRILAFASNMARDVLTENTYFFGDGTFKSCCRQFDQLYTIHGDVGRTNSETNIIPLVYAFLPDRQQATYNRLFNLIEKEIPLWSPRKFTIDFEMATIQSIRHILPNATLKGCNFHFGQCLWRKVQQLGMTSLYCEEEEEDVRKHIRKCGALSYLPPESKEEGWLNIMESSPQNTYVQNFNDYFVEYWMENDIIGDMWISYGERHRTTNALEGWHYRLNRAMGKYMPNIFELLSVLQTDAQHYEWVKNKIDLYMTPNKRAKTYTDLDERIKLTVCDFVAGRKTIGQCLNNLTYIVKLK